MMQTPLRRNHYTVNLQIAYIDGRQDMVMVFRSETNSQRDVSRRSFQAEDTPRDAQEMGATTFCAV